jgi:hypothetical protein
MTMNSTHKSLTDSEHVQLGHLIDQIWAARAVFAAAADLHQRALLFNTFPKSRKVIVWTQRRRALECASGFAETSLATRPSISLAYAARTVGVELVEAPERLSLIRRAAIELNTLRRLAAGEIVDINATLDMRVPKSLAPIVAPTLEMLTFVARGAPDALWDALLAAGGAKKLLAAENLPTGLTAAKWAAEAA